MKGQLDWKQRNHLKALSSASRYQDLKRLKEPRGDCVAGRATRQRAMGDGFFLEARREEAVGGRCVFALGGRRCGAGCPELLSLSA